MDTQALIARYFADIDQYPVLTITEETTLGTRLLQGRRAARLVRTGASTPTLLRLVFDGEAARTVLITSNLRLVARIARFYCGRGLDFLDLVQEGSLGLIRAVAKFHPGLLRHGRFAHYAGWWIKAAIRAALATHSGCVRLPGEQYWAVRRLRRTIDELIQAQERNPSRAELATALGCTPARVETLLVVAQEPLSLEMPAGQDTQALTLGDTLVAGSQATPEQIVTERLLYADLLQLFKTLTERQRAVIIYRFGLLDGRPERLHTIGARFGVSREAIRTLEARALARLRAGMQAYR